MAFSFGRRILIIAVTFAALAVPAYAADLTLYVGRVKPGELTIDNVRTSLDGSAVYGLRYASYFVRVVGIESTIAFSPNFLDPESLSTRSRAKGLIFNSNLLVNLPLGRVNPYATAGIGSISHFDVEAGPKFGNRFAVNYGGGLKLERMAGPLGLRFDARGYTVLGIFSRKLQIFEASAGLLFTF